MCIRDRPKFGFTPLDKKPVNTVNLTQIDKWIQDGLVENEITILDLKSLLHASNADYFKILGNGELTSAITITAHAFSKSAEEKITAAGGSAVKAFRTLEEASKVRDLPFEEALLKPKAKLVKRAKKSTKP